MTVHMKCFTGMRITHKAQLLNRTETNIKELDTCKKYDEASTIFSSIFLALSSLVSPSQSLFPFPLFLRTPVREHFQSVLFYNFPHIFLLLNKYCMTTILWGAHIKIKNEPTY